MLTSVVKFCCNTCWSTSANKVLTEVTIQHTSGMTVFTSPFPTAYYYINFLHTSGHNY